MTQRELAVALSVSETSIRGWETGDRTLPMDVAQAAIRFFRSTRLQAQICCECQVNCVMPPYLDLADDHPVAVLHKVHQELLEAVGACEGVEICNARSAADLDPAQCQAVDHAVAELFDLIPGIWHLAGSWQRFGVDPWRAAATLRRKLVARHYTSQEAPAA